MTDRRRCRRPTSRGCRASASRPQPPGRRSIRWPAAGSASLRRRRHRHRHPSRRGPDRRPPSPALRLAGRRGGPVPRRRCASGAPPPPAAAGRSHPRDPAPGPSATRCPARPRAARPLPARPAGRLAGGRSRACARGARARGGHRRGRRSPSRSGGWRAASSSAARASRSASGRRAGRRSRRDCRSGTRAPAGRPGPSGRGGRCCARRRWHARWRRSPRARRPVARRPGCSARRQTRDASRARRSVRAPALPARVSCGSDPWVRRAPHRSCRARCRASALHLQVLVPSRVPPMSTGRASPAGRQEGLTSETTAAPRGGGCAGAGPGAAPPVTARTAARRT